MFEEPIRFIGDVIRNDRPVLDMLYGSYTFVNPVLARHYGMPEVTGGPDTWVRVDNARDYQRGGLLPMAVFLTQNAPGAAHQPGEARILGGATRARRGDSSAASCRPGAAERRGEAGPAAAGHAGAASQQSRVRVLSRAVRCVRADVRRITGRSAKRERRIWPDIRSIRRPRSPAEARGPV